MAINLDAEARSRGLTRKGRDWILTPYKPVRPTAGGLPKPLQAAITGAAECGMTYWGPALGTGMHWAISDRREFHAIKSGTRGGATYSQHACGLLMHEIGKRANRIRHAACFGAPGFTEDVELHRQRELTRLQLAINNPVWQCTEDGPVITHAPISTAAMAAIQLELDQ